MGCWSLGIKHDHAEGLEVGLNGRWENGLRVRTGYSFVDARDERTDDTAVNSPCHLAKINVICAH